MSGYTVGDKGTELAGRCTDAGQPVDLTGAAVELHLGPTVGPTQTKAATITDPAAGQWAYRWAAGDLVQAGAWQVEAQVTSADASVVQTFGPARFDVNPQLG